MKIFTGAALALLVLSFGCKHGAGPTPIAPGSLAFAVDRVQTKATDMTTAAMADFGVYCFRHGVGDWATESATTRPEKMYNQKVVKDGSAWRYDPEQEWEGVAQKLSFFGYAPYGTEANKVAVQSSQTAVGVPTLSFEALPAIRDQIDLLVSRPVLNQQPQGQFVSMRFGHALAKVAILVYPEGDDIFIDRIEFSGISYKGSFDLNYPALWQVDPATTTYSIDYPTPGFDLSGATRERPYDATKEGNYLMTVPQSWLGNSTAKITFYYHTPTVAGLVREYVLGSRAEQWPQGLSTSYLCRLTPVRLVVEGASMELWDLTSSQGSLLVNNEFRVRVSEPSIDIKTVNRAALTIAGVDYVFAVSAKATSNTLIGELEPFYSWNSAPAFVKEYPIHITRVRLSTDDGANWADYPYTTDLTRCGEPVSIELSK